jgi:hypothetical protein
MNDNRKILLGDEVGVNPGVEEARPSRAARIPDDAREDG